MADVLPCRVDAAPIKPTISPIRCCCFSAALICGGPSGGFFLRAWRFQEFGPISNLLLVGLDAQISLSLLIHKCIRIQGMSVNAYGPEAARGAWRAVVARLTAKQAWPLIDNVFSFEKVPEAFCALEKGPAGKVRILIRAEADLGCSTSCGG